MSLLTALARLLAEAREKTIGALLEAMARRRAERDENTFSIALIALSAKMAKADGIVTDDEIAAFQQFFSYPPEEERNVRMLFQLAQQDVAGFDHYLRQVHRLFQDSPDILEDVLDCLFHVALADHVAHPQEMALLEKAALIFRISEDRYRRIKAVHMGTGDDDPFLILGVEASATVDDVKSRYRALMRQHHPDALMARGVPASLVRIAEARTAAINAAYEQILARKMA